MEAGRALRAARAGVFAALCVLLAAFGHVTMSGAPVPGWALALALGAVGAGSWALAGRERAAPAVVGAALGGQLLAHLLFSAAQAPSAAAPSSVQRLASLLLCGHTGGPLLPPAEAARVVREAGMRPAVAEAAHGGLAHDGMLHGGGAGMLAAHLAMAALGALWLWRGERAVFTLVRRAALRVLLPVLRAVRGAMPAPARPSAPRPADRGEVPRQLLLAKSLLTRGPPAARWLPRWQRGAMAGVRPPQ